jgi:hypothetical protein
MDGTVGLRFDTNSVMGPGSYSVKMALNNVASAEVNMAIGRLVDAHVDYLADAAVLNAASAVQFQGLVESVAFNGDQATISLRNGQEMTDVRMGGLGVVGVDVRELVWSLARTAGITEDKIAIPGWVPGPDELFEVVIPLSGLQIDRRFDIGDVLITAEPHVKQSVDDLGPDPIRAAFQGGSCWAIAHVRARTVFEAEAEGIEAIALAIGWLAARSHYAGASLPNAECIRFARTNTLSRIDRGGAVYVRGLATTRRWLRSPSDSTKADDLRPESVDLIEMPRMVAANLTQQEREAVAAWKRSVEAPDPMARVSAISESIEFLCAGVRTPGTHLFARAQRKHLLKYGKGNLSAAQHERVKRLVGRLNEPSLGAKLDHWLAREAVHLTPSDRDVLDRVREVRNNFVHGRSHDLPKAADLRYASSVVNRMLVHRVHNLVSRAGVVQGEITA